MLHLYQLYWMTLGAPPKPVILRDYIIKMAITTYYLEPDHMLKMHIEENNYKKRCDSPVDQDSEQDLINKIYQLCCTFSHQSTICSPQGVNLQPLSSQLLQLVLKFSSSPPSSCFCCLPLS